MSRQVTPSTVRVRTDVPVVEGALLKKSWAPSFEKGIDGEILRLNGNPYLSLSSEDHQLGQFLFGCTNSNYQGKRARNLPRTAIVRRIWKARDAARELAENQLLSAQAAAQAADKPGADVLSGIFGGADEDEEDTAPAPAKRSKKEKQPSRRSLQKQLPASFPVEIASAREGVSSVCFRVLRAASECLPSIEITAKSLQDLFDEVSAEREATQDEGPETPPRRKPKRRTHPLAASPGKSSGQSSPPSTQERKKRAESTFDKKNKRVVARWRKADGTWGHESTRVENPSNEQEVTRIRDSMLAMARRKNVPN